MINSLYYSTEWEKNDDGNYYRMIEDYNIGQYTIEELKELISNPNLNFEEVFGKNTSSRYEIKNENEITEEDFKEEAGFKIVYRYTDEEDIILNTEYMSVILFIIFMSLVGMLTPLIGVVWCGINDFRKSYPDFDIKKYVKKYNDEYQKVDIDELVKLFKEKKIKLKLIRHQQTMLINPNAKEKVFVR